MSRMEQVNELLREELSFLIAKEGVMDNALITIVYVDTSPDLHYAKIIVSILPDNLGGTALKKLNALSSNFSRFILKHSRLRQVPKFRWLLDKTEKKAADLEEIFKEIEKER